MTLEEAIRESIRKFYANKAFNEYKKEHDFKYDRNYFLDLEDVMFNPPKPKRRRYA